MKALTGWLLLAAAGAGVWLALRDRRPSADAVLDLYVAGLRHYDSEASMRARVPGLVCDKSAGCRGAIPRPLDGFDSLSVISSGFMIDVTSGEPGAFERARVRVAGLLRSPGRPYCRREYDGRTVTPIRRWEARGDVEVELWDLRRVDRGARTVMFVNDYPASVRAHPTFREHEREGACPGGA